ncbi:hypothetical protein L3N51_00673 [Metallosphaera sp. J1]|uniref:hypothetical protein n=1 Tax=Metallosphaera javensis (ex Hofmann et al. 2022) TaxID=99938 RepID=UPI001EDCD99C|nr:hypothetical protein [Metallosphaera javensis (ex Hofmann et al. 2022)]MCG3108392.1 hypothetical protein [Metallosphaera javensis (ex Hofmann et al. 2022)]
MDYWIQRYQSSRPSMKMEIIEVDVPCNSKCLESTEFRSLLENETFRSRIEVVDSLVELVREQVRTLKREIQGRMGEFEGDLDSLTFTIYRLVEYGGNTSLGERLTFEGRTIASGSFQDLVNVNKLIERIRTDTDIKSICDEIRYLIEALWEHFEKNMVKIQ